MADKVGPATISKDQLQRLSDKLLAEITAILKARDKGDPKMDRKSAILQALYAKVQEKLGLPLQHKKPETDFDTYEFAYRTALYKLLREYAKEPFEYRPIVNSFLKRALKKG